MIDRSFKFMVFFACLVGVRINRLLPVSSLHDRLAWSGVKRLVRAYFFSPRQTPALKKTGFFFSTGGFSFSLSFPRFLSLVSLETSHE